MALQKAMVSSETPEHGTPQWLFDILDQEFHFTLDPCATAENAKCVKYYTKEHNGLLQDWAKEVVFINPPYCRQTSQWVKKAYEESEKGVTVVMLLSAATGRKWWQEWVFTYARQIRWVEGFIKFVNATYSAPFASAIVVFSRNLQYQDKHVYRYLKEEIKLYQKQNRIKDKKK